MPKQIEFKRNARYTGLEAALAVSNETAINLIETSPIQTFFSKEAILNMLARTDCRGIRFYPSLANNTHGILAIGVKEQRDEFSEKGAFTILSASNGMLLQLSREEARETHVALIQKTQEETPFLRKSGNPTDLIFSAYFSKHELEANLAAHPDTTGIRVFLDEIEIEGTLHDTYTAVAVRAGLSAIFQADSFFKSALPCPPNCGGQENYLPYGA